jgi:hypothetical protein
MDNQTFTLTIDLAPEPTTRDAIARLLRAYLDACARVRKIACDHHTRHQAALHALAYRSIFPKPKPGLPPTQDQLPSQYAIRAISRVSHQLRCEALKLGDPYPPDSLDLDSRSFALDLANRTIQITSLGSTGLRGQNVKGNRLAIAARFQNADIPRLAQARLQGGHLTLKPKPRLIARFIQDDPQDEQQHHEEP